MSAAYLTILLAVLAGSLARTIPAEDEYTLQAIEELRHLSSARLLSDLTPPECTDQKKESSIECCMSMKWMSQKRTICIELGFNATRLRVDLAVSFDGEEIIEHALTVGEVCAPLPGLLKQVNLCLHAYYVNVDMNPPRISFDSCFVAKLGGFFHLRMNCISLDKAGNFKQHADVKPESKGVLMLSLEEGNVKFDSYNPIPKELMDKIEQGWDIVGKEAGNFINDAGEKVTGAAKTVEKELSDAADKAKEAVVGEFNKVTGAIGALGGKISGIFG